MRPVKRWILPLALAALLLFQAACSARSPQEQIAMELGLDASDGTEVLHYDTHGGNGDGTSCYALQFSDDTVAHEIRDDSGWTALPLDTTTEILAYGQSSAYGSQGPYLTDSDGNALLPQIENGYYCFIDRQAKQKSLATDQPILERASFNFTLAVYDTDQNILYYCQLDT